MTKPDTKNPAAVALGALGGRVSSAAKTEAARLNAKKGGWPKGRPRGPKKPKTDHLGGAISSRVSSPSDAL